MGDLVVAIHRHADEEVNRLLERRLEQDRKASELKMEEVKSHPLMTVKSIYS